MEILKCCLKICFSSRTRYGRLTINTREVGLPFPLLFFLSVAGFHLIYQKERSVSFIYMAQEDYK